MVAVDKQTPPFFHTNSTYMSSQLIICTEVVDLICHKFMTSLWTLNHDAIGAVIRKVIGSKSLKIIGLGWNLVHLFLMFIGREFPWQFMTSLLTLTSREPWYHWCRHPKSDWLKIFKNHWIRLRFAPFVSYVYRTWIFLTKTNFLYKKPFFTIWGMLKQFYEFLRCLGT